MAKKPTSKKTAPTVEEKVTLVVADHALVPKHELCSDEEKKSVLTRFKVQPNQLPRITAQDPAVRHLGCKVGDLIKITRQSETAGEAIFYRIISSE